MQHNSLENKTQEIHIMRRRNPRNHCRDHHSLFQVRFTGSKLATAITAPVRTTSTTPPEAKLSKPFFREVVTAASATSGTIIEAVNAAAVSPVTAFSFIEARTLNFPAVFGDTVFDGRSGGGLKNAWELGTAAVFWPAFVSGIAIETAEIEAICDFSLAPSSSSAANCFFSWNFCEWGNGRDVYVIWERWWWKHAWNERLKFLAYFDDSDVAASPLEIDG